MSEPLRIGNCSGFYGDRLSAALEMVEGGPLDVLTGDYLAELTMAILHQQRRTRGAHLGYVGTFLKQVRDVAAVCRERNIKLVSNAGGLNPGGLAAEVEKLLAELGVDLKVAWIDGDDLLPELARLEAAGERFISLDKGLPLAQTGRSPMTANIYLGAWGIKEALDQGADLVICPRVTDAAVVMGPAAWKFNWARNNHDALAGALTAGHIIECGAQCCGGNYAFFEEVPSFRDVGYPIAEMEADGSFTVTKHPGTGGLVSVGTVTAQLLYEISSPAYRNPDVIAHFDTLRLEQTGRDRVRVSGARGSSPPDTHKVCVNMLGPCKQSFEVLLTGLDVERKAEVWLDAVFHNLGGREQFDEVDVQLVRSDKENPRVNDEAYAALRVTLTSSDPEKLGRLLTAKVTELGLACIPGNAGRGGGGYDGSPVLVHWPTRIDSRHVTERVHLDGETVQVRPTQQLGLEQMHYQETPVKVGAPPAGELTTLPLGRLYGTRSGDKGGCANCGVWAKTDQAYAFLYHYLTVAEFKHLCPDLAEYEIERFDLPNLRALNFYIHGVLGDGVSSNHRIDKQAKSMGEYLRARHIRVPKQLAAEASA